MKISKENGQRIVRMEGKEVRALETAIEICRELGEENKHVPAHAAAGGMGQLIEQFGPKKKPAAGAAETAEATETETDAEE